AVSGLDLQEFGLAQLVLPEGRNFVFSDYSRELTVRVIQSNLSRRANVAPMIKVECRDRVEIGPVTPFRLAKSSQPGAVELYAIDVARDRTVFGCGEINLAGLLIDAADGPGLPLSISDLTDELAIHRIEIDVVPPGALALPKKGSVVEKYGTSDDLDPGVGLF